MLEGDPKAGHTRAGYSIRLNGGITIIRTFVVRPNSVGTDDDHVLYAGAIRYLNSGDRLTVVITYQSLYESDVSSSCFGVFKIV